MQEVGLNWVAAMLKNDMERVEALKRFAGGNHAGFRLQGGGASGGGWAFRNVPLPVITRATIVSGSIFSRNRSQHA